MGIVHKLMYDTHIMDEQIKQQIYVFYSRII